MGQRVHPRLLTVAPRALVAVLSCTAIVAGVAPSPALARGRAPLRACGQVQTRVPHTGSVKIYAVDRVSARRVSCARARGFVRGWEHLADIGKLPNRAGGRVHKSVLVFNRWGRPYRVNGFVCRSLAFNGPGPIQPEIVNCGAPAGLVTWREGGYVGSS
jgi:hypothetical protein